VIRGYSRPVPDVLRRRLGHVQRQIPQIPKLTVRVRFPSSAPPENAQLARYFPRIISVAVMGLLTACPLRARSLERGLGAPADLVGDDLVEVSGAVLIDQGGAGRGAAHPVHDFAEGRARFTGQCVAGMAKIVEVEAGQARQVGGLRPLSGEVAPP
jgi:hypothetical protein